jgi:predicted DsbA family dithiol-disulfide isomerase
MPDDNCVSVPAIAAAGSTRRRSLLEAASTKMQQEGGQDAVVEDLFSAYFVEGRDVGDKGVLADLAVAAGIDRARASVFLAGTEGADEVAEAEAASKRSGMNGAGAGNPRTDYLACVQLSHNPSTQVLEG